ncbi:phage capsid protein [Herbaspirillum seropedicae]|uniref:phage capsid protein n=1 Tax=Herbaspirillum seropedicae TaxID=964 RepID=UPI003FCC7F4E
MPQSITQAFVQQFDTSIRLQAQQRRARFESRITDRGNITGESFTANRLDVLADTPENTTRHGDTVWSDANHTTRVALMRDFYQALPVDRADEPKVLANPTGSYMDSLNAAWNRRKDSIIYAAGIGNAQAKDGSLIALPSSQIILNGGTGFTKAKLITAKKLFRANEADEQADIPEELNIAFTSDMLEDILSDTTLTSADFLAVKMLQEGNVAGKWMGFNWVPYEKIQNTAGVLRTMAWAKSAIHFGTGFFEGRAQRRGDKKDTMQVSAAGSVGAVRVWEYGVVAIDFV